MMPYSHKNDLRNRGITGVLLAAKSFLSVARIWRGGTRLGAGRECVRGKHPSRFSKQKGEPQQVNAEVP